HRARHPDCSLCVGSLDALSATALVQISSSPCAVLLQGTKTVHAGIAKAAEVVETLWVVGARVTGQMTGIALPARAKEAGSLAAIQSKPVISSPEFGALDAGAHRHGRVTRGQKARAIFRMRCC